MNYDRFFDPDSSGAPPDAEAATPVPAALDFLADWGEDDWARLFVYTEQRRFRAGERLINAGEVERSLLIVGAGELDVLLPNGEGMERRAGSVQPGDVIGEVAFFDGSPRSASVRAVADGEARVLSRDAFEVFAAYEPVLARAFLLELGRVLATRLRAAEGTNRA